MKIEEVKNKMNSSLDNILKNAMSSIQQCKDENELNQISDSFLKEMEEKILEFDKEIKSIKESRVYEGLGQDALIAGRIMFGMIKDEFNKVKASFDKKYADAKTLEAKKNVTIQRIKSVIDGYKKKISDINIINQSVEKFKKDNNMPTIDTNILSSYGVKKVEELVGKNVNYKKDGYKDDRPEEEQEEMIASGEVKSVLNSQITIFNKNINQDITKDIKDLLQSKNNPTDKVKSELGKIKDSEDKMKKISNILPKIIANIDDADKLKAAEDALS